VPRRARIRRDLEQAREALEHGRVKRALRHAWEAGLPASSNNDADTLRAVIGLGSAIRDQASGREAEEAGRLVTYCTEALEHPRKRTWPGVRSDPAVRQETKICPDCAETVKAAARVCRFCGFRFET
jgi:hypothetical protein